MGWIIFADILLIIIVALCLSVSVSVRIDEDIRIKVRYAGITIFSISPEDEAKKKAQAKKKSKKKNQPDADTVEAEKSAENSVSLEISENSDKSDNSDNSAADGKAAEAEKSKAKSKGSFSDNWEMIKTLIESASKPVKRLISHIRVADLFIDITASGEDAAQAALNYGKINWLVHSAIAFLYQTVRLYVKKINIGVDFTSGNTEYFISCKIRMRLSTAIGCALWFLVRAAKLTLKKTQSDITGAGSLRQSVTDAAKKGI